MYTGPLEDTIKSHNIDCMSYADDTQVYCSFHPAERDDVITQFVKCLEDVRIWNLQNKLKLNDSKTEVLHVTSRFKSSMPLGSVKIGQSSINPSRTVRNLGVIFDSHLTMCDHVNNVCKTASYALRSIGLIRKYLDRDSAEQLIHAFITSRLDYCNSLFLGLPDKLISKLQKIQNAAARLVTGAKKRDHITQVLRDLHWLPIRKRIIFKTLLITFKALNNAAPDYIRDLLVPYHPSVNLRSSSKYLLTIPRCSSKTYGDRAFSVSAPKLWNSLPLSIRKAETVAKFKTQMKTYLFNHDI
jgi:hypothetical protein